MTTLTNIFQRFVLILGLLTIALTALADDSSYGYQMAMLDERTQNPQDVLLKKTINPDNATVREFEWILETFRNRCPNPPKTVVTALVQSWRLVQRRGYDVTLLEFSREVADFSNVAFRAVRNQKIDISRLTLLVMKKNYPVKK
ncbi:MAG: hypothetical protein H6753_04730 [Candidatus Omnitrophica bacterium]|nr:hypothetical protein [Candidatus Omnitrophota bacterium]